MLTVGVWILVAWFVGIPLALWALYGLVVVLRSILDAIDETCATLLAPFTAGGRARMREAGRAAREAAESAAREKAAALAAIGPDEIRRQRRRQNIAVLVTVSVGVGFGALIGISQGVN